MTDFDRPLSIRETSQKCGRALSEGYIRDACHRGADYHPLPHIRTGSKKQIIHIRWSEFIKWYEEEERFQVGTMV